jgi:hypothetical protein
MRDFELANEKIHYAEILQTFRFLSQLAKENRELPVQVHLFLDPDPVGLRSPSK